MRGLISFLLISIAVSESFAQIYIPMFDLQGHRGARGVRPENSIPAFILALDSGVTTVEMDLAITKDKQIVVSHEPWMSAAICLQPDGSPISSSEEKTFNIYQMDYERVRTFDCGSRGNEKFPEQVKMKTAKPLLRDAIIAIEHHIKSYSLYEVDYNIEIKTATAKLTNTDDRIGGGTAARHFTLLHIDCMDQLVLPLLIHECHHSFFNGIAREKIEIDLGHYIYQGIANAVHIVLFTHEMKFFARIVKSLN